MDYLGRCDYLKTMKYLDIKDTPLRFHKFYSKWILSLDSFLNLVSFFSLLQLITRGDRSLENILSLGLVVVFIVLCFAAFRGLMYFRRSSFLAAIALLSIQILDNIYRAWIYLQSEAPYFGYASILSSVLLFLILVYYIKRRKLFTKEGISLEEFLTYSGSRFQKAAFRSRYEAAEKAYEETQTEVKVEEPEETVGEYDCPRCGFHITDGAVFCPKCGAQTRVVRR